MMPVILILFSVIMIMSSISTLAAGGSLQYDEQTFQKYAMSQYNAEFGDSGDAYEDNLLIVFLTSEEAYGYECIAIIGDNVKRDINLMFGNEYTDFGVAVQYNVDYDDHTYSLSSGLAGVMDTMATKIERLGLGSSFYSEESHERSPESHVVNNSSLSVNEKTIDRALADFTEKTDIPVVIVIDDMDNVFEFGFSDGDIMVIVIGLIFLGVAIFLIVSAVKGYKESKKSKEKEEEPYNRYAKD